MPSAGAPVFLILFTMPIVSLFLSPPLRPTSVKWCLLLRGDGTSPHRLRPVAGMLLPQSPHTAGQQTRAKAGEKYGPG